MTYLWRDAVSSNATDWHDAGCSNRSRCVGSRSVQRNRAEQATCTCQGPACHEKETRYVN